MYSMQRENAIVEYNFLLILWYLKFLYYIIYAFGMI